MILKDVAKILTKLSDGENLTTKEAEEAFDVCLAEDKEAYFFTALTMGLMAKGITSDELFGFCKSRQKLLPEIKVKFDSSKITDNSGTGGDKLKTFNVSTTAAFIIAAADIAVAKQSYFAVTGIGGSGDLFREFGIDVVKESNPKSIKKTIEKVCFTPYIGEFLPSPDKIPGFLGWVKKRGKTGGLNYISPYHLAANVLTPIKMERRVYSCFDRKYLNILAELFQKLGYKKGLIIHGIGGLDEVSNIGNTEIVEFTKNKLKNYTVSPEDFGVKKAKHDEIKAISVERNVIDFLRILFNKEKGPKRDIVLMNASASLFIMDKVSNFKDGVELSKKILEENKAADKLVDLVKAIGDIEKLNQWKKLAKV